MTPAITELINIVYRQSERGLRHENASRTNLDEVIALTRASELAIAQRRGRLAGVVRIEQLDDDTGQFGMLAAAPHIARARHRASSCPVRRGGHPS